MPPRLRALNEQTLDAVFLDINMPGLSGMELAGVLTNFSHPRRWCSSPPRRQGGRRVRRRRTGLSAEAHSRGATRRRGSARPREPGGHTRPPGRPGDDVIPVELGGVTQLVRCDSIGWVEAEGDYARLHTATGSHLGANPVERLRGRPLARARIPAGPPLLSGGLAMVTGLRTSTAGTLVRLRANGSSAAVELPVSRRQAASFATG